MSDTRARNSLTWVYVYQGFLLGQWASVIPQVQLDRTIDNAVFGLVLVAAILGAIVAVPVAAKSTEFFGTNNTILAGCTTATFLTPALGFPPYDKLPLFVIAVVLLGFNLGILDIAANIHVTLIEKKHSPQKVMGFYYAIYSAGCLSGALFAGILQELLFSILDIFLLGSVICALPSVVAYFGLYTVDQQKAIIKTYQEEEVEDDTFVYHSVHHSVEMAETDLRNSFSFSAIEEADDFDSNDNEMEAPAVIKGGGSKKKQAVRKDYLYLAALTTIGFISFLAEGSISDWSGIYLENVANTTPGGSAAGYVVYQIVVMVSRYESDKLSAFGVRNLLIAASVTATVGFVITGSASLLSPGPAYWVAVLGLAVVGGGMGAVVPVVVGSSAKVSGWKSSDSVAILSAVSYLGILVGPPLLGWISVVTQGLQYSLLIEAILVFLIVPLAFFCVA